MMIGYAASSAAIKPAIRYAGRLLGDALSTLPQTETDLIQGTGTQVGNCGGATCTRWGDYSAMSLDPNGCTFWFTSQYYAVDGSELPDPDWLVHVSVLHGDRERNRFRHRYR